MNKVKRPLIFLKGLPSHELNSLNALVEFYTIYCKILPQNLQIYTHRDGSLDVADDTTVDTEEEIICASYDEFLSNWNQYKLWAML